jgi:hypothetical protein
MRKKFSCHKLSAAHIKVCEIASLAKKETMETLNVKLQAKPYTSACSMFRTAYQISKLNHPMNFCYETGYHLAVMELPICLGDMLVLWLSQYF